MLARSPNDGDGGRWYLFQTQSGLDVQKKINEPPLGFGLSTQKTHQTSEKEEEATSERR